MTTLAQYLIRHWEESCLVAQELVPATDLPLGCTGTYVNQYLGFTGVEVQEVADNVVIVSRPGYASGCIEFAGEVA